MHFYVWGRVPPPLIPVPSVFVPTFHTHFVGTNWEDTNMKFFNFFPCLSHLGGNPTPPRTTPTHDLRPWVHLHFGGQFEETLWDKSNIANDIIKFLLFSELFLGMDGCSHMGTCMYRGNQWPPTLPQTSFLLIRDAIMNIYQGGIGRYEVLYGADHLWLILLWRFCDFHW